MQSSPRPSSPVGGAASGASASGSSVARPSSPAPPGGARTAIRRRAAADQKEKIANAYVIRDEIKRALEIAPGDSNTLHMMGRWCFTIAGISEFELDMIVVYCPHILTHG